MIKKVIRRTRAALLQIHSQANSPSASGNTDAGLSFDRQLGRPTRRIGTLLAVMFLFFGAMTAALLPAPLEQRIGSVIFFGLTPAISLYLSGYILSYILVFSGELFEMIAAHCFRYIVIFACNLVSRARLSFWGVHAAIFEASCLLIRNAACFAIRMLAHNSL